MDARFDMVMNNILQVINSEHFEPFPREQSHDAQGNAGMINQPVLKVLCEKAVGNEHFAKVPVKRELRSSGL